MLLGKRLIRGPAMTQQMQKTFGMVVGVIFFMLIAVGGTVLYHYRNVSFDLSLQGWLSDEDYKGLNDPKAANKAAFPWLSDEDIKVLKDPNAANKAAYEKMSRELWELSQSQQSNGWNQGWKK
jgi:hypothetical protein